MQAKRIVYGLLGMAFILPGCPKSKIPCDPSQEQCIGDSKQGKAPETWCEAIDGYLSGFECLTLAGEIDVEAFGPSRDRLSEGTLSTCFGGKLPSEIPIKTQNAQLPSYVKDFSSELSGSAGLDLQKVGNWLPNASVKGGKGSKVTIEISFESLERSQISDIALGFRSKLLRSSAKSTLAKLDSCMRRLCRDDYLAVVEVLSGFPKITITTEGQFDFNNQIGWDTDKVDLGASAEGGSSKTQKITMRRKKEAGPIVVAARVLTLADSMKQDGLCDAPSEVVATPEPKPKTPEKPTKTEEKPAKNLGDLEAGLKASVRRILSGTGNDPKQVKLGGKQYKIGDKITASSETEASLVNEDPIKANGKTFSFGDSCKVKKGATLHILGFFDGITPEALVRYDVSDSSSGNTCPKNAIFFYLL